MIPTRWCFRGRLPPALAITHGSSGSPQNCNISGMETGGRCRERGQQLLKPDFLRLLCVLSLQILGHGQREGRSGTQRAGAGGDHEPLALQGLKQAHESPGSGPRCVLKLEVGRCEQDLAVGDRSPASEMSKWLSLPRASTWDQAGLTQLLSWQPGSWTPPSHPTKAGGTYLQGWGTGPPTPHPHPR